MKNTPDARLQRCFVKIDGFIKRAIINYFDNCFYYDEIQDIRQTALIKAFRYFNSFDPQKGTMRDWASSIAYKCCIDYLANRKRYYSRYLHDTYKYVSNGTREKDCVLKYGKSIFDTIDDNIRMISNTGKEQKEWLNNHIGCLPENRRTILEWTLDGVKPKEIAGMLGCTPNKVSIDLHRTKKDLKDLADKQNFVA